MKLSEEQIREGVVRRDKEIADLAIEFPNRKRRQLEDIWLKRSLKDMSVPERVALNEEFGHKKKATPAPKPQEPTLRIGSYVRRKKIKPVKRAIHMENKPLTYGQKAVGIRFNHATGETHNHVDRVKQYYADIIDDLNNQREASESGEQKRLLSVAITQAQDAQMWAVKAYTWTD